MTSITFNKQHKADFDYCEEIIKHHSKSFYAAFSNLPPHKARCVYAVYAFCRAADDSIDEHHNINELNLLEEELEAFLRGQTPSSPIWRALRVVFDSYEIDPWAFRAMIDGQKKDYRFRQPQTQNDLEAYCYLVAGSVGLMLMPLLSQHHREWRQQAVHLGVAMQITNILRDVGEDLKKGRVYLPRQCMDKYCYTMQDLHQQKVNEAFVNLWEHQAQRAEELYLSFETALPLLDDDAVPPVLLATRLYAEILNIVRENNYHCFHKRAFVPDDKKQQILRETKTIIAKGLTG